MKKLSAPSFDSLSDYYKSYWKYVNEDDILAALAEQMEITKHWLDDVPEQVENYMYADGKWMLKEVIGHLCDTERILSYRALRFSRNDKTSLTKFDENSFMAESNFRLRSLKDIADEWETVRSATITLFSSMTDEMADRMGNVEGLSVSSRIILYFILAHERHHLQIIKERYLTTAFSV